MRKFLLLAAGLVFTLSTFAQQNPSGIRVITGELFRTIPSLKDLKPDPSLNPPVSRDLTGTIYKKTWKDEVVDYGTKSASDPVVQKEYFFPRKQTNTAEGPLAGAKVMQNYDGMPFTNVAPADPCLAQGPNHVIQMINGSQGAYFRIWDKTGANVVAQTYMYQIIATPGYTGWGDPIVLYDQFSDRYIISEFGTSGSVTGYANTLIFAVSATNNPSGAWNLYKFVDNNVFIDYPHYSVWPNAIFGTSNDFNTSGTAYLGSSVMAFDKAPMIAGSATATMIRTIPTFFGTGVTPGNKPLTTAPVSISGATAPASPSAGLFLYYHDDNLTATASDVDSVGIISMTPDFTTPANTTIGVIAQIPVAAFKANVCASRACVPGGSAYDAVSDRFMHRISYRNFGTYEAIVANHTVDANYPALPAKAGIRWYEFRKTGAGAWGVQQQGTYSPDADGRWMGGININSQGQIALAFNHSGANKFASILFTGRNATDPPGVMVYDEEVIQAGTAYGTFGNRWGDYNDLTTDVTNDSIFWFTAMYGATNWKTRVASFKLEPLPALDARLTTINSPATGLSQCADVITPQVTIRNAGTTVLTSLKISTQLNGGAVSAPYNWTGSLSIGQSALVTLPNITGAGGANTFKVFTYEPNGGVDENKINDTATSSFTVLQALPSPIVEGFESTTFPPANWQLSNPNAGSITWARNTAARRTGAASAKMDFYNYSSSGHIDILWSSILDTRLSDSVILSFWRAYKPYSTSAGFADSLVIVVSTDCGATYVPVWSRGGSTLSSTTGTTTASYTPVAADWANTRLDLKPFIGNANSILVGFRTVNAFGNNLYLDDINITTFRLPFRDALIRSVAEPFNRLCTRTLVPNVTIGNLGRDTLKSVKILYQIGSGALDSIQWTGALPTGGSAVVNFATYNKSISLAAGGNYVFNVYTKQPNALNDENNTNDTARIAFTVFDPQPDPVKEGFEQATFPPANWSVASSGTPYTWQRTTRGSTEKTASAWIRNYRFNSGGKTDDLFSPLVQIGSPDSVLLRFDVAHATAVYPGSTGIAMDTLEILLTSDCGKTYRSVYKKWGEDLTTVDRNFPLTYPGSDTIGFVPNSKAQWRSEYVDVSKFVASGSKFQFVFRSTSNKGNNILLDNIDISTITLPARLKQNGYMIAPNPFEGSFQIRHLLPPANLKGLQVMNSSGQVVVARSFNGNASNNITIDLSAYSNGAYQVKLIYDNKVITERIIKRK